MKRDRVEDSRTWPIKSFLVLDAETLKPFPFFKDPNGSLFVGATADRPYGVVIELYENHNATFAAIGIDGIWSTSASKLAANKFRSRRFWNGTTVGELCFAKALRTADNGVSKAGTIDIHFGYVDHFVEEDTQKSTSNTLLGKTVPELQDGCKFFESQSLCSVLQNEVEYTGMFRKAHNRALFQIGCRYDDVENIQLREGFVAISPKEALESICFVDMSQKKVKETGTATEVE
jgi:hypothetical protein